MYSYREFVSSERSSLSEYENVVDGHAGGTASLLSYWE